MQEFYSFLLSKALFLVTILTKTYVEHVQKLKVSFILYSNYIFVVSMSGE